MTAYNAAVDLVGRNDPDRLAIIDDDGRYTYGEVADRVAKAAGALAALGVQPLEIAEFHAIIEGVAAPPNDAT